MAVYTLTAGERRQLEEIVTKRAHLSKDYCRAQAVLWFANGKSVREIANLLRVSRQTVYNWLKQFQKREPLDVRKRLGDAPRSGRPRAGDGQIDEWIDEVIDKDPRDFGYQATAWTAPLLARYLEDIWEIVVSPRTVGRALSRLRIRWKRPRHALAGRSATWRQAKGGSNAA